MKNLKFLAALVAALCMTGTAWALPSGSNPAHLDFVNLSFRSQVAANPVSQWDSLAARRVGAAGASSVLDTTVAFSTEGLVLPSAITGGATDTSGVWLTLHVYSALDGGDDGCESGADSLAVAMQVSVDGTTWFTTAAVPGQTASASTAPITTRNNQTILNGAFKDALSLNGAALANGQPAWTFKYRYRGINQLSVLDCDNAWQYPYIRFVLSFHDAKGYKVHAKVAFMSVSD